MLSGYIERRLGHSRTVILQSSLALGLGPVVAAVLAPLLARALGVEGRGQMAAVLAPLTFADALITLGLPTAANYFRAKGVRVGLVVKAAIPGLVLGGLSVGLALWYLARVISTEHGLSIIFVLVAWSSVLFGSGLNLLRGLRMGGGQWGAVNLERVCGPAIRLVLVVVLQVAGLATVQAVTLVYLGSGVMAGLVLLRPRRPTVDEQKDQTVSTSELMGYGLRAWPSVLSYMVNARLDQLVLAATVSTASLGLYAVAVTVAELPAVLYTAVNQFAFTRSAGGNGWQDTARYVRQTLLLALIGAVTLAAGAVLGIPMVFGDEYSGAIPAAVVLICASPAIAVSSVLAAGLSGHGRPGLASTTELVGAALTVLGLLLSIPRFGIEGAAVTTLVAALATLVARLLLVSRVSRMGAKVFFPLTRADYKEISGAIRVRC
jgi:O-antigen/teichoic acid export membrane protein